jgi:hypothetical protein
MNAWHNITYVYDHTTSTSTVYVDNAVALTFVASLVQGISSTSYPGVQFADYWNGTGVAGLGLIYFYTRAITVGEVAAIYNQNSARFLPPAPALIAQYDVSDPTSYSGTGNTLYDISGNGHNLDLINSPTFSGTGQSKTLLFEYNSTQYAVTPNVIGASVATPITVNAWLKSSSPASFYASAWYFGNTAVNQYAFGWSDYGNGDNWLFEMTTNGAQLNSGVSSISSDFVNLVLSIGSGTYTAYINGIQVGTSSQSIASWINPIIQLNSYPGGGQVRSGTYNYALFEVYNTGFGSTAVANLYATQSPRFVPAPPYVGSVGGRIFGEGLNG